MMNGRVLVTGAAGFTGRYVVEELLSQRIPVRAMVRGNSQLLPSHPLLEVCIADLVDEASIDRAVSGCAAVIHIAALFRQAGLPESEFYRVNVEGTRALVEASVRHGVKRFVHCSTVGVHGHIENPPGTEETPYAPGDMYQRSKLEGELLVREAFSSGRLRGMVIRPAMIYGPGDLRTLKLFKMVARRRFFYVGKGDKRVHFVDVRDLAKAFVLALHRNEVNDEVVIVAGRHSFELREFVEMVAHAVRVRPPRLHVPVKPMQFLGTVCETICTPLRINPPLYRRRVDFYTKTRAFDGSKAHRLLGYCPAKGALDEVIDIVNSYVEMGEIVAPRISSPVSIERDLEGAIRGWDSGAERLYGYQSSHAVGSVSHKLFKTVFPYPLERINRQLEQRRVWVGPLRHLCRDGREVEILSSWELVSQDPAHPFVRETNRVVESDDVNRGGPGARKAASFVLALPNLAEALAPWEACLFV